MNPIRLRFPYSPRGNGTCGVADPDLPIGDPYGLLREAPPPTKLKIPERFSGLQFSTPGICRIMKHFDECSEEDEKISYRTKEKDFSKHQKPPNLVMFYWEGASLSEAKFNFLESWVSALQQPYRDNYCITIFTTQQFLALPDIKSIKARLAKLEICLVNVENIHQLNPHQKKNDRIAQILINYHGVNCEFAGRADWWRVLLLRWFGGHYFDMDIPPFGFPDRENPRIKSVGGSELSEPFEHLDGLMSCPEDQFEQFLFGAPGYDNFDQASSARESAFINELFNNMCIAQENRLSQEARPIPPFLTRYFPNKSRRNLGDKIKRQFFEPRDPNLDPIFSLVAFSAPTVYTHMRDNFLRSKSGCWAALRRNAMGQNGEMAWARIHDVWEKDPHKRCKSITTFVASRLTLIDCIPLEFHFYPDFLRNQYLLEDVLGAVQSFGYRIIDDPRIGKIVYNAHTILETEELVRMAISMRQQYLNIMILEISTEEDKRCIPEELFFAKLTGEQIFCDDTVVVLNPNTHQAEIMTIEKIARLNKWSEEGLDRLPKRAKQKSHAPPLRKRTGHVSMSLAEAIDRYAESMASQTVRVIATCSAESQSPEITLSRIDNIEAPKEMADIIEAARVAIENA